jgi:hypothetical protein
MTLSIYPPYSPAKKRVTNPGNKKGPRRPLVAHRHVSRVGLATPGGALRYDDQRNERTHVSASVCSHPNAGGYKHCVMVGQANCGNNLAGAIVATFKLSFEIVMTRQTVIVNQS